MYPNTITEKACKFLAYCGWALRGRIREENSQGGNIVHGATDRAGKLTLVCRRYCGEVIISSPLDPAWENNPPPKEHQLYRVSFSKLAWSIGPHVVCCRGQAKIVTTSIFTF